MDVPVEYGGVNRLAPVAEWGGCIVSRTQEALRAYDPAEVEFVQYLPKLFSQNPLPVRLLLGGLADAVKHGQPRVLGAADLLVRLKADNAAMLASIDEIDGGLIALTQDLLHLPHGGPGVQAVGKQQENVLFLHPGPIELIQAGPDGDEIGMWMEEKMGHPFFCCDAVLDTFSRQIAVFSGYARAMLGS